MFYTVIYLLHNVHQNVYIRGSLKNNMTDFLSQISSAQLGTKATGNEEKQEGHAWCTAFAMTESAGHTLTVLHCIPVLSTGECLWRL